MGLRQHWVGSRKVPADEWFNVTPNFLFGDVPQAERHREAAVIRAGFVRACLAFERFRGRMERCKPFGQLRAEKRKGGDAAKRRQMSRAGVVADKHASTVNECQQFGHGARGGSAGFAGLDPPLALIRIAGNLDAIMRLAQSRDELAKAVERPDPDGLARAGVDEDFAVRPDARQAEFLARRQFKTQRPGHDAPMFVAMRAGVRPRQRLCEGELAAHSGKAQARFCSRQPQQKVVARVPTGGQAEIEAQGGQFAAQPEDFAPGPAQEAVFVREGRPGRNKRNHFDGGPKPGLQVVGVGLCQDGYGVTFTGRLEEGRGDHQVAQAP